jgi:hypothetical protein
MIKNVAYFPSQCAQNSRPVMSAVLDYFQARGIQTQENSMTSDAAVIWSVLWAGRMAPNQAVYQHYRQQGRPVIVLEIGALYRGRTWKVAVNNITREGYYGHEQNLNWDRPSKLGISQAITFSDNPRVVIAAQHARSLQVSNIDMTQWTLDQIDLVKQHTDRPIVVRPHPRSPMNLSRLPSTVELERPKPVVNTYDSFDMRFNYHAVINYNSGPGIQAAIAGCRPIVHESSLAHPVSIEYKHIEQPYQIDRDLWLTQICHTEYTLDELRTGTWLKRLEPALTK